MNTIAVIGAGNIGSRHLQALANLDNTFRVYVVDPLESAIKLSKSRYEEIKNNDKPDVTYLQTINELPNIVDVAILATNSDIRRQITEALCENIDAKHIIFEKVLFQYKADYKYIWKLLEDKGIKAWTNCWRRAVGFYEKIKVELNSQKILGFEVTGSNWGLASNAIHLIDLFAYLTDKMSYTIFNCDLCLSECKRDGFCELHGEMEGLFDKSIPFKLKSTESEEPSIKIEIQCNNTRFLIDDKNGVCRRKNEVTGETSDQNFSVPYQSQMTEHLIKDIINTGECVLTPFKESYDLHLPMIKSFTKVFQESGIDGCPIT